jgi:response regulator RpfG family c-di-GMP phosphodiesterase
MLVEETGTHFDPRLVELFRDRRDEVVGIHTAHRSG